MKISRWQIAAVVVAVAVVCAGKHYYRDASAGELKWFLAPTAKMVSAVTDTHFVYEAGQGYIDRNATLIIAPGCAGVNFALAAFLALTLGWLAAMRTARSTAKYLASAVALAYAATLLVNTIRIVFALKLHRSNLGALDRADVHQVEGIVVYLGGLCALYSLARRHHAVA